MSQKELDYVKDAITHEESIIKILESSLDYLEDESLISYFKAQVKSHTNLKNKLLKKLESLI